MAGRLATVNFRNETRIDGGSPAAWALVESAVIANTATMARPPSFVMSVQLLGWPLTGAWAQLG